MDEFDARVRQMAQQEVFSLPEGYAERIRATCDALRQSEAKKPVVKKFPRWVNYAAAAIVLFVALPNTAAPVAHAMEQIPFLGAIVKVITFRDYTYDDDTSHLDAAIPRIESEDGAAAQVNDQVQAYVDEILADFEARRAEDGGMQGLDVGYAVVTDSDTWFTLRLDVTETQASGYNYSVYYHIDKITGKTVSLGDLFRPDSGWQAAIRSEILRQMDERMAADSAEAYFPEDFTALADDQNFYYNADGKLVIAFNEYDVAPGSMGCPEFIIPSAVYADFLA